MKKRFKNILLKSKKKNGIPILICAVILTICVGTLVGCSIAKEDTGDVSDQPENENVQSEQMQPADNSAADNPGSENVIMPASSEKEAENADTTFLKVMREGEMDEIPATLFVGEGYSIYLTDDSWQQYAPDAWLGVLDGQAVLDGQVQIWITHFENKTANQVREELADDGYRPEDSEIMKLADEMIYKVRLNEFENDVWGVFYCYPIEAEEGWGAVLPVIADTFAVSIDDRQPVMDIPQNGEIYGYISAFGSGSVTIDRQIWVTPESETWKPEYNDAGGFEVVDVGGEDIIYPFYRDCTFSVLENHWNPVVELDEQEFENYLQEMEYPVLWIIQLEDGQIKNISEQYIP